MESKIQEDVEYQEDPSKNTHHLEDFEWVASAKMGLLKLFKWRSTTIITAHNDWIHKVPANHMLQISNYY